MSFDDFIRLWEDLEMCHLTADCFSDQLRTSYYVFDLELLL